MRVSADKEDPDYSPAAVRLQVLLSGVEQRMCITADDARGEILRYALTDKGYIFIPPGESRAKTEWVTGKVEILVHPKAAPAERCLTAEQLVKKYQASE